MKELNLTDDMENIKNITYTTMLGILKTEDSIGLITKEYIKDELEAGCTIFRTKGGFLEKKRYVIMSTVSNRDYFKLKEGVH